MLLWVLQALANNHPPSCGMPYASLDIARITAVQSHEHCLRMRHTCLRVVTSAGDCGATPPIPYYNANGTIDTAKFLADQANYQKNQLASLGQARRRRSDLADAVANQRKRDDGAKRWILCLGC